MAYQLQEINAAIRADAPAFLAECDQNYHKRVVAAADKIVERMTLSPIVLLSGPSGSGKTTTALKLEEELEKRGINTHTVSLDNYFLTRDPKTAPRTADGEYDLESPLCLDMKLLDETFTRLTRGEEVIIPHFEFSRQMRNDARGRPLHLKENEIAIFEGIHALGPGIAGPHPEATRLYISARSNVMEDGQVKFKGTWMRLTRRAVRDYNFRGNDISFTLAQWANVRRGEKLYISPYKNTAHVIVDSSLPYEVSVMKNYALPLLKAVPEENQRKAELLELMAAFETFEPVDPALVPKNSLLREFIGGGSYHYK